MADGVSYFERLASEHMDNLATRPIPSHGSTSATGPSKQP
jgi:hypothetical protein